jgi:hypothetical protein
MLNAPADGDRHPRATTTGAQPTLLAVHKKNFNRLFSTVILLAIHVMSTSYVTFLKMHF